MHSKSENWEREQTKMTSRVHSITQNYTTLYKMCFPLHLLLEVGQGYAFCHIGSTRSDSGLQT